MILNIFTTLCIAFKLFIESGKQSGIEWKPLPSIHNDRWNSRAIYALLAYLILSKWLEKCWKLQSQL